MRFTKQPMVPYVQAMPCTLSLAVTFPLDPLRDPARLIRILDGRVLELEFLVECRKRRLGEPIAQL